MAVVVMVIVAVVCTLASHMGLTGTIGKALDKILGCTKCFTFWVSVIYFYTLYALPAALACAIATSYLSIWIEMGLVLLNGKYNELWKRLTQRR
jgi:hypothetical protein